MKLKTYTKPELKSRQIDLGVFGNYSGGGDDGNDCGGNHRRRRHGRDRSSSWGWWGWW